MINSHAIIINADIEKIFQQALLWGEAEWWPKGCLMRYARVDNSPSPYSSPRGGEETKTIPSPLWGEGKGEGRIQVGTRYHQKVLLPFAPEWDVEVASITQNREVKRRFLNGIFSGTDSVILKPVKDGVEVKALMDFEVNGYFNKLAWRFVFERMHDENVEKILKAMKRHCEAGKASRSNLRISSEQALQSRQNTRLLRFARNDNVKRRLLWSGTMRHSKNLRPC